MLCSNLPHVLFVPHSLYKQLKISVAVHRVWHKDIKSWSLLIRNILKLLTAEAGVAGKVGTHPILLAIFDSLLIL